jgi:uncharacterized protein YkuJ
MLKLRKFLGGDDLFLSKENLCRIVVPEVDFLNITEKYNGIYQVFSGILIAFFCSSECLYLLLNEHVFLVDKELHVIYNADGDLKKIGVLKHNEVVCEVTYKDDSAPVSTLTYVEDEEDANFGLWLSNVISSEERRSIFLSYNCR